MRHRWRVGALAATLSPAFASPATAEVRLPAVISSHMVLQQGRAVPIWGWAEAGERVTVQLGNQRKSAEPGTDGRWEVRLGPLQSGTAGTLTIEGRNRLVVEDVLVGEVWLGSGQSNMAMRVSACRDFEKERAAAEYPQLRMFTESSTAAEKPATIGKGEWVVCTPATVGTFSASLYFMGRELHTALNQPVGLINTSVGGTPIQSWIDAEAQANVRPLRAFVEAEQKAWRDFDPETARARHQAQLAVWMAAAKKARDEGKPVPRRPVDPIATRARRGGPGGLFNGKVAPLIPYGIRGAVWYQGEANSGTEAAPLYGNQLALLVEDWRRRWGQGDFPFAWVQLPNYDPGAGRDWPRVREEMLRTLRLPHTGMAITIDIGEARDIHPKNKQDVGRRLATWALSRVYDRPGVPSGPLPRSARARGGAMEVTFDYGEGLTLRGGEPVSFELAGEDGVWKAATARLDGTRAIVSSPEVARPVAVRYAWSNNPRANLYNGAGLPASPFRLPIPD